MRSWVDDGSAVWRSEECATSKQEPVPQDGTLDRPIRSASIPLGEFEGDPLGAFEKHDPTPVIVEQLTTELDAVGLQPNDLGLDVGDREAKMVEADMIEIAKMRLGQRIRMTVPRSAACNP